MIKVLIVDDHSVVRAGLKQILADQMTDIDVGEAADARSALDLATNRAWDIVILDVTLPDKSGLDVLKELKRMNSALPVLMLSMHPEDQFATRALRAGAAGYITKECAAEELVGAIQKVISGGKYISATLGERLASEIGAELPENLHSTLSDREYQILCCIASGQTVSEIAQKLNLSVKTISTYRTRILEKMSMDTNAQLTHYAVKNHLVE